jgi:hypothetical protein
LIAKETGDPTLTLEVSGVIVRMAFACDGVVKIKHNTTLIKDKIFSFMMGLFF